MTTHSAKGAELVAKVSRFADLVPIIRGHHEAWNGAGYPDRLAGELIPIGARIIAFADTLDAMTTSRPYRGAMSTDQVRAEILEKRGTQFDPRICDALLEGTMWDTLASEVASVTREFPIEKPAVDEVRPSAGGLVAVSVGG